MTAIKRGETAVGPSSKDAIRHRARRMVEKELGRELPPSVHVDHKRTLKAGKVNANQLSNLRTRDAKSNTSAGGKSGSRAGKAAGGRKGAAKRSRLPTSKPD